MKQIFIIRHGETDNNKFHRIQGSGVDASLNELGREQAEAIAVALEKYPIQKVVTSSLKRTKETAAPFISRHPDVVVESYPDLVEMGFGNYEGLSFFDIKNELDALQNEWDKGNVDIPIPGGESPQQVYDRANNKCREVLEHSPEEYIVFVIHGRLIRVILSVWLGYGLEKMHMVEHQNASINHLIWDGENFEAVDLNSVEHLLHLV